jgi:hypothetical protein
MAADVGRAAPILAPDVRGLGERRQRAVVEYLQEESFRDVDLTADLVSGIA